MSEKLVFDSDALVATANKVLDLSERTNSVVQSIQNEIDNLSSVWQGHSYSAIVNNINNEIAEIKKLLDNYETTGKNVNSIARNLGETSENNASTINNINY